MGWRVVERKIGRAGSERQQTARQREWDREYGADAWVVGYVIDGECVLQDDALESVYYRSNEAHFRDHPGDLTELVALAKVLRNPHAEATTGVDLQVPAITRYLEAHGLALRGTEVAGHRHLAGRAVAPDQRASQPTAHPVRSGLEAHA